MSMLAVPIFPELLEKDNEYYTDLRILEVGGEVDSDIENILKSTEDARTNRVAKETNDELKRVLKRVDHICGVYDLHTSFPEMSTNTEYIQDLRELEELLRDTVKKRKYQQQVTIFIVGYEKACSQKLKLLQQVNEFFLESSSKLEEDDPDPDADEDQEPPIDLDELSTSVEDTIFYAESLGRKLGEINADMVDYVNNFANSKASNKGKKKLEKSLQQAKDDIAALNERLLAMQREIIEKDDKIQQMFKQIELKNLEAQRFKTAAEAAKKGAEESLQIKDLLATKERELRHLQDQLKVESQISSSGDMREKDTMARVSTEDSNMIKLHQLQTQEMKDHHKKELKDLRNKYQSDLRELQDENMKLKEEIENARQKPDSRSGRSGGDTLQSEREPSNVEAKDNKKQRQEPKPRRMSQKSRTLSKQSSLAKSDKSCHKQSEPSDTELEERIREFTRANTKTSMKDMEMNIQFEDAFALDDEAAWNDVPMTHLYARFKQYRSLTREKISELEEKIESSVSRTQKKVITLKSQFQEIKKKWANERKLLIQQVEQSHNLQNMAEKEADKAMKQLESFINEQEQIEAEEEAAALPPVVHISAEGEMTPVKEADEIEDEEDATTTSDLEKQTDDAKAERLAVEGRVNTLDKPSGSGSRTSSAKSRSSVRTKYKETLEEQKAALEELRSRTPVIPGKSVLDDANVDENGDIPFPGKDTNVPDEEVDKIDMATSPFKNLEDVTEKSERGGDGDNERKGFGVIEHPIVQEYLKAYGSIVTFKNSIGKLIVDKDMNNADKILKDIVTIDFNEDETVQPQIEAMTKNVLEIMDDVYKIFTDLTEVEIQKEIIEHKEPKMQLTDNITQAKMNAQINMLQQQMNNLQNTLESERKRYQDQLEHNTVMMVEMQSTIQNLKHELDQLRLQRAREKELEAALDGPVMFTRLNSERNSKTMKKAVLDNRLDQERYLDAVEKMEQYNEIPGQRLGHLVKKYVHHKRMKQIEDNVRQSKHITDKVFDILDKMEDLQNKRAQQWADKMDNMGTERLRLAKMLMDALDAVEQESGIFLIKPMYSYSGNAKPIEYGNTKASRPHRAQKSTLKESSRLSAETPVPTPAAPSRGATHTNKERKAAPIPEENTPRYRSDRDDDGLAGNTVNLIGTQPGKTWQPQLSEGKNMWGNPAILLEPNTPKVLELDVNRMLLGQNLVSHETEPGNISDDRLVNAANNNLRSYVTVGRPIAGPTHMQRSGSKTTDGTVGLAHYTTPASKSALTRKSLPVTPPLPPIGHSLSEEPITVPVMTNERTISSTQSN